MRDYAAFLDAKTNLAGEHGFEPVWMPDFLFPFQSHLVGWALRGGRRGVFADTGLGKTAMELAWAENVARHTGGRVLILAPLAVGVQTVAEGEKFGVEVSRLRPGAALPRIGVINYQQLHRLDPGDYAGVECDESGILKHFDGATRKAITRFLLKIPYRLLASATPAPNDWSELGSSSEALGELTHSDMIEEFFEEMGWEERRRVMFSGHFTRRISLGALDTMTGRWRLKGYAHQPFWRWIASWARACRKPSDLDPAFDDREFALPPLIERDHVIPASRPPDGMLFTLPALSMRQELDERRRSLTERCERAAQLLDHREPGIAWCQLNAESALLAKLIPDAVEVTGALEEDEKEERIRAFLRGEARVLVTKSRIAGLGLNFQHCAHMVTFATHSFEGYYQSVRRCWRYGQMRPVTVDVIWTEGEIRIQERLRRKCARADEMFAAIIVHMRDAQRLTVDRSRARIEPPRWLCPTPVITDRYALYHGDCIDVMVDLPEQSVHLVIYSPPFGGLLYQYSSDPRDLSNSKDYTEFFEHYEYVVRESARLLVPGRMALVHCMEIPDGGDFVPVIDFPGDIIRLHRRHGFEYAGRYHIWKEPLTVRNRTMLRSLHHKTVCLDSTKVSLAHADYLLRFRRRGVNPVPVAHPTGLMAYAGERLPPAEILRYRGWPGNQIENQYSQWIWRQYASSFWDDIRLDEVLSYREAREEQDESHIHPLQLDVINRGLVLWSNPGETVLSPFAGIGSEVYAAVLGGRRGVGIELKASYYRQMVRNVSKALGAKPIAEQIDIDDLLAEPPARERGEG